MLLCTAYRGPHRRNAAQRCPTRSYDSLKTLLGASTIGRSFWPDIYIGGVGGTRRNTTSASRPKIGSLSAHNISSRAN